MATTYTRELHQDILERLQMQAFVCNATPSTPPAINILEALALLAKIDRLTAQNNNLKGAWEEGYKFATNLYYDDLREPDDFAQEARLNTPYKEEK